MSRNPSPADGTRSNGPLRPIRHGRVHDQLHKVYGRHANGRTERFVGAATFRAHNNKARDRPPHLPANAPSANDSARSNSPYPPPADRPTQPLPTQKSNNAAQACVPVPTATNHRPQSAKRAAAPTNARQSHGLARHRPYRPRPSIGWHHTTIRGCSANGTPCGHARFRSANAENPLPISANPARPHRSNRRNRAKVQRH